MRSDRELYPQDQGPTPLLMVLTWLGILRGALSCVCHGEDIAEMKHYLTIRDWRLVLDCPLVFGVSSSLGLDRILVLSTVVLPR